MQQVHRDDAIQPIGRARRQKADVTRCRGMQQCARPEVKGGDGHDAWRVKSLRAQAQPTWSRDQSASEMELVEAGVACAHGFGSVETADGSGAVAGVAQGALFEQRWPAQRLFTG